MKTRILLVDDDFDILDMLSQFLSRKGFLIVGTATNGMESVELYKRLRPDVVLMDIVMPKYDGKFGLQKILEYDQNAKIIVVTGCVSNIRDELKKMGAVEVLSKPCGIDVLSNLIKTAVKKTNQIPI